MQIIGAVVKGNKKQKMYWIEAKNKLHIYSVLMINIVKIKHILVQIGLLVSIG